LKQPITKKGLVEWLKEKALNSSPSTAKKKKERKKKRKKEIQWV
jgi:ribosomal protein S21